MPISSTQLTIERTTAVAWQTQTASESRRLRDRDRIAAWLAMVAEHVKPPAGIARRNEERAP